MDFQFIDGNIFCSIDLRLYSKTVVQKCFYWYTSDYRISYAIVSSDVLKITLTPKSDQQIDKDVFITRVCQDLNDFLLRDVVNQETKTIRELIVAKAFANFEDINDDFQFDALTDPVGFNSQLQ